MSLAPSTLRLDDAAGVELEELALVGCDARSHLRLPRGDAPRLNQRGELLVPFDAAVLSRSDGHWVVRLAAEAELSVLNPRFTRKVTVAERLLGGEALVIGRHHLRFEEPAGAPDDHDEHRRLRAAVARTPEDAHAWLVYGDWLVERGDPCGERVAERVTEWPERLARFLPPEVLSAEWHFGHVHTLRLHRLSALEHLEQLAVALWSRAAELTVELRIERGVAVGFRGPLQRLLAAARLPALRRVRLPEHLELRMPHCPWMPQWGS